MRGESVTRHRPLIPSACAALLCLAAAQAASAAETPRYAAEASSIQIQEGPGGPTEKLVVPTLLASNLLNVPMDGAVRIDGWPVAPGVRRPVRVTRHDIYDPAARIMATDGDRLVEVPRSPLVFFWGAVEGEGDRSCSASTRAG